MADEPKRIAVLEKALQILEYMVDYPTGISLHNLSTGVQLNKSTVYRILNTLKEHGYIAQNEATSDYRLDYKFLIFSSVFDTSDIRQVVTPHLRALTDESSFSASLAILRNDFSVTVDRTNTPGNSAIRVESQIGFHASLHSSASGKAMLSGFSDEEFDAFVEKAPLPAYTAYTITNPIALKEELMKIRDNGYSVEYMENEENIISISAPIKDQHCRIFAAITVTTICQFVSKEEIPVIASKVMKHAALISQELGCPDYKKLNFKDI